MIPWFLNMTRRVDRERIRTSFQKIRRDISPVDKVFTRGKSSKKMLRWFSSTCDSDKTGPKFEYANPVSKRRWHLSRQRVVQHSQMEDRIQISRYIVTGCYCKFKKMISPQISPKLQKLITNKNKLISVFVPVIGQPWIRWWSPWSVTLHKCYKLSNSDRKPRSHWRARIIILEAAEQHDNNDKRYKDRCNRLPDPRN